MNPKLKKLRATLSALLLATAVAPLPLSAMEIGINLTAVNYYSNAWPFADFMKSSGDWLTTDLVFSDWDTGQRDAYLASAADVNGWPTKLPFTGTDGKQHFIHLTWQDSVIPTGTWTLAFKGEGSVEVVMDGKSHSLNTGATPATDREAIYTLQPTRTGTGPVWLRVRTSDPNNNGNYIRDIKLIAPDHYNPNTKGTTKTFHQTYLDSLAGYKGPIRFMDWGGANKFGISTVANVRQSASYYTQGGRDVAVEYMVEMANAMNRDLWYCAPHNASPAYITEAANVIKNGLNSNLKVWVELSNEVWNPQFNQHKWATAEATARSTNWPTIYAEASAKLWKGFRDVFGTAADARVVRVLAGQRDNDWTVTTAYKALENLTYNPHQQFPEVLSPASYISNVIAVSDDGFDSSTWSGGNSQTHTPWVGDWVPTANATKVLASGSTSDRRVKIVNNGSITRTVNTTQSTNNTLGVSVSWSATGLEAGEGAYFEVDPVGDGNWVTAASLLDGADDGTDKKRYNSTVAITPSANTKLRVRLAGNDANDTLVVNSVTVLSHPSLNSLVAGFPANLEQTAAKLKVWTKFANQKGVVVYCYEGGQHYLGKYAALNDSTFTSLMTGFNRSSQIYGLYIDWLDRMQQIGIAGIANFADIAPFTKDGSWGAFENHLQPLADRHKYRALMDWTPDFVSINADILSSYATGQDLTPYAYTINTTTGTEIKLGAGNVWKKVPFGYRVTSKTRVKFDFKSDAQGELHGLGFETDNVQTDSRLYKVWGTQTIAGMRNGQAYTNTPGTWQPLDFSISHVAGSISYLVFMNDHDVTAPATPTATSWFRNIQLYEAP